MPERTIILDKRAEASLDDGVLKHPGLSEVYRALEWRLARDAESGGLRIPRVDPPTYVMRAHEWVNTPSLVVLYRFDADTVTVLRMRVRPTADAAVELAAEKEQAS